MSKSLNPSDFFGIVFVLNKKGCWKHDEKFFDLYKCSGNQKLLQIPGIEKLENGEDYLRMINSQFKN